MTDTQLLRAVANCLWPDLRRDRWRPARVLVVNDPTGNPTAHRLSPAQPPRPQSNPRIEEVSNDWYIRDYVYPEEHPAGTAWALNLTKAAHDSVLGNIPEAHFLAYLTAKTLATCRQPFEVTENRHGKPGLRRNSHDALITPECAAALEAIAAAAVLEPLSNDQLIDLLLIRDDEIDLAAIERATKVRESQEHV